MISYFDGERITFEDFKRLNPDFNGVVNFYVSGSQGVAPTDEDFEVNDQDDFERMGEAFNYLADINANDNKDDYINYDGDLDELEEEDEDEYYRILDEAQEEARIDSGILYLRIGDRFAYTFDGSDFWTVNEND
jgi:hypothetical protein